MSIGMEFFDESNKLKIQNQKEPIDIYIARNKKIEKGSFIQMNATNLNATNDVTAGATSLLTTASQTTANTASIGTLTSAVAGNTSAIAGLQTSVANKANLTGADNTFTNSQQFNGANFLVGSIC